MANVQIRKRQWVALLLAAAMLLELLPFAALKTYAAEADEATKIKASNVTFVDEDGNTTSIAAWMQKYEPEKDFAILTDFSFEIGEYTLGDTEKITWYVAENSANWTPDSNTHITIQGDVRLILQENSKVVNVHAIDIEKGGSLTIYGATTSTSENMGKLNVDSGTVDTGIQISEGGKLAIYGGRVSVPAGMGEYNSGIKNEDGGTLKIYGGKLTITGVDKGKGVGIDGAVEIRGGKVDVNVDATSATAFTGPTTISGGTVNATGSVGLDGDTTVSGGAQVTASSIEEDDRTGWNGLVLEKDEKTATVYGDVTLTENTDIPEGMTLFIPAGSTLTLADDVNLTLDKIDNEGLIYKGTNSQLMTYNGAAIVSGEDGENNVGKIESTTEHPSTTTNSTKPTQNTPNGQVQNNVQAAQGSDGGGDGLMLLLVGGGIAVGAVVYYRIREQRKAAAEAQLDPAATEETTEAALAQAAGDTVAVTVPAEAAETVPETTTATATPDATETAALDMAA
jgi:hypothetical protein